MSNKITRIKSEKSLFGIKTKQFFQQINYKKEKKDTKQKPIG